MQLATRPAPDAFLRMQDGIATSADIHDYLARYEGKLPDVQSAKSDRCDLFPTVRAFVFQDDSTSSFLAELFGTITTATRKESRIPDVEVTRYDLFHAHLFQEPQGRLGLLFHAKEFPELCKEFPYNLGYCQRSSELQVGSTGMDWRNFLWYNNSLAALDLSEDSRLLQCLVPEYLEPLRTTYEVNCSLLEGLKCLFIVDFVENVALSDLYSRSTATAFKSVVMQGDFGTPLGDVYYFPKNLPGSFPAPSSSLPGVVLFFPRTSPPE